MKQKGEKVVKSTCRGCHGVCGVLVHIKDGKVIKVTGDRECPTSNGYICAKGKAAPELLHHPDRLKYPIKRTGPKGDVRKIKMLDKLRKIFLFWPLSFMLGGDLGSVFFRFEGNGWAG